MTIEPAINLDQKDQRVWCPKNPEGSSRCAWLSECPIQRYAATRKPPNKRRICLSVQGAPANADLFTDAADLGDVLPEPKLNGLCCPTHAAMSFLHGGDTRH